MERLSGKVRSLLLLLAVFPALLQAQVRFTTQVSSTKVGLNEPFQVNFILENAEQVSGFQPPQFTGFDILQQSQSTRMDDNNGQVSQSVTYSFLLKPRSIGAFTVEGAMARNNGNKLESNPVTIDVVKDAPGVAQGSTAAASSGPWTTNPGGMPEPAMGDASGTLKKGEDPMDLIQKNLFAKAEVDKTTVYAGQQITATYKLFTRLHANSQVTKVPAFTGFSAHDIDIPNPVQPSIEKVGGVPFEVFTIRKTMLFPLQAGDLELDPVEIHNSVRLYKQAKAHSSNDPLSDLFNDPFFKDPFGNDPFGNGGVSYQDFDYTATSPPVKITVKPLPTAGQPAGFGGAVGRYSMTASVDKSTLSTDDAGTLKITLSGSGNIDMVGAPKPDFPTDFDSYDPKVTDHFNKNANPFSGTRTFEYVFMPKASGSFDIPSISFSYFDPAAQAYKTLESGPFHIQVSRGKQQLTNPVLASGSTGAGLQPLITGDISWTTSSPLVLGSWWNWGLMALPIVLLSGLLAVRTRQQNLRADTVAFMNRRANKVALRRLAVAGQHLKARDGKAFYDETSRAIWGYLSHKLNIPYASLTREKVHQALLQPGMGEEETGRLFSILDDCEVALYAPAGGQARMEQTYEEALKMISQLENRLK